MLDTETIDYSPDQAVCRHQRPNVQKVGVFTITEK